MKIFVEDFPSALAEYEAMPEGDKVIDYSYDIVNNRVNWLVGTIYEVLVCRGAYCRDATLDDFVRMCSEDAIQFGKVRNPQFVKKEG